MTTTAAAAAQALVKVTVRIVFVPLTAAETVLAVGAGRTASIAPTPPAVSAAQIAVEAVSVMVRRHYGFWVVKLSTRLPVGAHPEITPQGAGPGSLAVVDGVPSLARDRNDVAAGLQAEGDSRATAGFAPMLEVQVTTTAAAAASVGQGHGSRPVVPAADPVTGRRSGAGHGQVVAAALAAQIAVSAVSLMVPGGDGVLVVKLSTVASS